MGQRTQLLPGHAATSALFHCAIISIDELVADVRRQAPADLLLFRRHRIVDHLEGLAQRDAGFLHAQFALSFGTVLEAGRSRGLDIDKKVLDNVRGCLLERCKQVCFEDLGPRAGDLTCEGVGKLHVEVGTPRAVTAKCLPQYRLASQLPPLKITNLLARYVCQCILAANVSEVCTADEAACISCSV